MQPTPEEKAALEADENERTTETGLFHYAVSYHAAADALGVANSARVTHPDAPREFLYVHAIELYLKAFLRDRGMSVHELRGIGHKVKDLGGEFQAQGGFLRDEDRAVLDWIDFDGTNLRARYIKTGYFKKASLEALSRTAVSLRDAVGDSLKSNERIVRWDR